MEAADAGVDGLTGVEGRHVETRVTAAAAPAS
jgi:hypothetical protein